MFLTIIGFMALLAAACYLLVLGVVLNWSSICFYDVPDPVGIAVTFLSGYLFYVCYQLSPFTVAVNV